MRFAVDSNFDKTKYFSKYKRITGGGNRKFESYSSRPTTENSYLEGKKTDSIYDTFKKEQYVMERLSKGTRNFKTYNNRPELFTSHSSQMSTDPEML